MNKNEIILVGGGGHCKSCIDVIEADGKFSIKGIIDLPELLGSETLGYSVIGNDDDLQEYASQGYSFLITMGHLGNSKRRDLLYTLLQTFNANLPTIISPKAYVSKHSNIGSGTIIMHGSVLNADSVIGENCIINSQTLVEHDTVIMDHCHISTGAIVNGNCFIGKSAFIGSGVVIKNEVIVTSRSIIGMGSVVTKNIESSGTYIGCPAKKTIIRNEF